MVSLPLAKQDPWNREEQRQWEGHFLHHASQPPGLAQKTFSCRNRLPNYHTGVMISHRTKRFCSVSPTDVCCKGTDFSCGEKAPWGKSCELLTHAELKVCGEREPTTQGSGLKREPQATRNHEIIRGQGKSIVSSPAHCLNSGGIAMLLSSPPYSKMKR